MLNLIRRISPLYDGRSPSLPGAVVVSVLLAASLPSASRAADIPAGELSTAEIADIVRQQAAELASQRALIDKQQGMLESQRDIIQKQQQELSAQRNTLNALQAGTTPAVAGTAPAASLAAVETPDTKLTTVPAIPVSSTGDVPAATAETELKASEKANELRVDDPLLAYDPSKFAGAIPLPGTAAALRIGGFVKANAVETTESLGTPDRFIVGSIPTDPDLQGDPEAAMTASQSRLNFELRENSTRGQFRAFIEGDFAGAGDTFRLRQAFGQFGSLLAGETWSTFMDTEASPEELDFEGINGRINKRHTQFRYFPDLGHDWNLAVALEEPDVVVQNGTGLSQIPDVVLSAKRSVGGLMSARQWHLKTAALYRSIRARPTANPEDKEGAVGWGLSISGQTTMDLWGLNFWDPRDTLMFQANYGEGYSSYVNDLSTIGFPDAAFDPLTGKLDTITAFAWYMAVQHWWQDTLRSNLIVSQVKVDELSFVVTDEYGMDYDTTWRVSGNVIWSPVPRVDVGGELLWGKRSNSDGSSGTASQFQFSVKYLF